MVGWILSAAQKDSTGKRKCVLVPEGARQRLDLAESNIAPVL